jgi:hypothetical protein
MSQRIMKLDELWLVSIFNPKHMAFLGATAFEVWIWTDFLS